MKRQFRFIDKILLHIQTFSNVKTLTIFFLIIVIFNFLIFPYTTALCTRSGPTDKKIKLLDTRLFYSSNDVKLYVLSKSLSERKCDIIIHLSLDTIYPIAYTIFISALLLSLTKNIKIKPKLKSYISISPFAILIFDYLENISIIVLLIEGLKTSNLTFLLISNILPFLTLIKWLIVFLIIIFLIVIILYKWYYRKYIKP